MLCLSLAARDIALFEDLLLSTGFQERIKESFVELRMDYGGVSLDQVAELCSLAPRLIYTHRYDADLESSKKEDIGNVLSSYYQAIHSGVAYIDLDLSLSENFLNQVIERARQNNVGLIISSHNYETTPDLATLEALLIKAKSYNPDIIKIVTRAETLSEVSRVLSLYHNPHLDRPLLAFTMGESTKYSRHLSLKMGAPFIYVCSDKLGATASGQYTVDEALELLDEGRYKYDLPNFELPESLPLSKSIAQRAILAAFLSGDELFLQRSDIATASGDIASARTMVGEFSTSLAEINVGESGLLCRMMMALCAVDFLNRGETYVIRGCASLSSRVFNDEIEALRSWGLEVFSENGRLPISIKGRIKSAYLEYDASKSSQFASGLFFALPLLSQNTELKLIRPVSLDYLTLTLDVLLHSGINIECLGASENVLHYKIAAPQTYAFREADIERDWSAAAYLMVAERLLSGSTSVPEGLNKQSVQADRRILDVLNLDGTSLKAFDFDATHSPDLFPILAVLAANSEGLSRIKGISRLYNKESNRAQAIYYELSALGYMLTIDQAKDQMLIEGGLSPSFPSRYNSKKTLCLNSYGDHRMVIALAVAAKLQSKNYFERIMIDNLDCIKKSFLP